MKTDNCTDMTYLPEKIRIDICNLCQLDCVACWIRKNEDYIKKYNGGFGYVTFETFKNFVDRHPFIKEIEFSKNGEVFLNPDLDKIIKYAYEKNITLTAYNGVNLNYLKEETAENLVKYKFNRIYVSIDGATPETYAIYRRKGDFNKVIENIKTINKYKKIYNSEFPVLTYKFVVFGHNEHEIEQAKELAKELNMNIYFDVNYDNTYSPVKDKEKVKKLAGIFDLENNKVNYYKNNWFWCRDLFLTPQINWNGEFIGCCFLYLEGFKVNVFEEGLEKALQNEKIWYAKQMLLDYKVKPRNDIPCASCDVYKFLKETNLTLF